MAPWEAPDPSGQPRGATEPPEGRTAPAYLVLARDVRLAGVIAAGLRSRLAETGDETRVLVPPLSGGGFAAPGAAGRLRAWWDGQCDDVELSSATLVIVDAEELAGLGRLAYVAVPSGQAGARTYPRGGAVLEVPAETVGELVDAVVFRPDARDPGHGGSARSVIALSRPKWRATRVWGRGLARTAVLTGVLGVGAWLLSTAMQPAQAQAATVHDHGPSAWSAARSYAHPLHTRTERTLRDRITSRLRASGVDLSRPSRPSRPEIPDGLRAPAHLAHHAVREAAMAAHHTTGAANHTASAVDHATRPTHHASTTRDLPSTDDAVRPARQAADIVDDVTGKNSPASQAVHQAAKTVSEVTGAHSPAAKAVDRAARVADDGARMAHTAADDATRTPGHAVQGAHDTSVHVAEGAHHASDHVAKDAHNASGHVTDGLHKARGPHTAGPSEGAGQRPGRAVRHDGAPDATDHSDARDTPHPHLLPAPSDIAPHVHLRNETPGKGLPDVHLPRGLPDADDHLPTGLPGVDIPDVHLPSGLPDIGLPNETPSALLPDVHLPRGVPDVALPSSPHLRRAARPSHMTDGGWIPALTPARDSSQPAGPLAPLVPQTPVLRTAIPDAGKAETAAVPPERAAGTPDPSYDIPLTGPVRSDAVPPYATPSGPPLLVAPRTAPPSAR